MLIRRSYEYPCHLLFISNQFYLNEKGFTFIRFLIVRLWFEGAGFFKNWPAGHLVFNFTAGRSTFFKQESFFNRAKIQYRFCQSIRHYSPII